MSVDHLTKFVQCFSTGYAFEVSFAYALLMTGVCRCSWKESKCENWQKGFKEREGKSFSCVKLSQKRQEIET